MGGRCKRTTFTLPTNPTIVPEGVPGVPPPEYHPALVLDDKHADSIYYNG
jgi:hypothetical protein